MKKLVRHLHHHLTRSRNGHPAAPPPAVNLETEIRMVQHVEGHEKIEPGKRIHEFRYGEVALRLDRDVLGLYRVTVNQGSERLYSFTIVCPSGDYTVLRAGYETITAFLDGNRHPTQLPNTDWLKGHYYGH